MTVSRSSGSWILSLKLLLISAGVLSMAVILKLSVPVVLQFIVSELPGLWSSLSLWLTPPYLYVVINGIIITIAASSRFQNKNDEQQQRQLNQEPVAALKVLTDVRSDFVVSSEYESVLLKNSVDVRPHFGGVVGYHDDVNVKNPEKKGVEFEVSQPEAYGSQAVSTAATVSKPEAGSDAVDDGFVISRSNWTPSRSDAAEIPADCSFFTEKPLVSSRFGHRKTVKASPEAGKALGVAKPKRNDTLESTWKTITEGRPIPLARHLKKSDTWETHGRHGAHDQFSPQKVMKSETFKERSTMQASSLSPSPSPGSGKLRKEPSLSQDELNRRVEAFIKKFNDEMRLQRQESLNQYREMMNRGIH